MLVRAPNTKLYQNTFLRSTVIIINQTEGHTGMSVMLAAVGRSVLKITTRTLLNYASRH
jgi:hypothetical protein